MFVFPRWQLLEWLIYIDQCSRMKLLTVLVMLSNTDNASRLICIIHWLPVCYQGTRQRQQINMYHTLTASLLSRYSNTDNTSRLICIIHWLPVCYQGIDNVSRLICIIHWLPVCYQGTRQCQQINMYHTLTASLLSRYKHDTNIWTNNKSVFYGNTRFLPLNTTHQNRIINLVSDIYLIQDVL